MLRRRAVTVETSEKHFCGGPAKGGGVLGNYRDGWLEKIGQQDIVEPGGEPLEPAGIEGAQVLRRATGAHEFGHHFTG